MIVSLKPGSSREHAEGVVSLLSQMGVDGWIIDGSTQFHVEVLGVNGRLDRAQLEGAPMVERILDHAGPLLAAGRQGDDTTKSVPLGAHASIGGRKVAVIAGPCSVESRQQVLEVAAAAKEAGAVALRGGAFKPRTSPYSFPGHGERGLEWLAEARETTGLAVVTEVMRCEHVPLVSRYTDMLQIGSRNMHHMHLLAEVGRQPKPVLLKRGWSATLDEFLLAAEYVMLGGNHDVVLCERGIRTHETYVRNTLALSVVPAVKHISTLPIIVDPSHGTGRADLVAPMSNAAIACGADGLLIEVHANPKRAWTDGQQTLDIAQFHALMMGLKPFLAAAQRTA